MTVKRILFGLAVSGGLLAILLLGVLVGQATVQAQTDAPAVGSPLATGFSYQGYLAQNGTPIAGQCDFQFGLFAALGGGTHLGSLQTVTNVTVVQGRFTVLLNDANQLTANPFTGEARYLEIRVRCPAGGGGYTTLSPRQNLTATPYALGVRPGATISGTVGANSGALNLASNRDGLRVVASGGSGVFIDASAGHGLNVSSPEDNGLHVRQADNGVYVNQAMANGVFVNDADANGLRVIFAGANGVQIDSYANNGLQVQGGTPDSLYAASLKGGLFIQGGCTGCTMQLIGVNAGRERLRPGDVVTAVGSRSTSLDGFPVLFEVRRAAAGDTPIGVVVGSAAQVAQAGAADTLVPRPQSDAAGGDFVTVIIDGPAQVRADYIDAAVAAGDRLTVAADGHLRALRAVEVDGVTLAEAAPTLGVALEAANGAAVWVLVNP